MEQEIKYTIKNKETADAIWDFVRSEKIAQTANPQETLMKAIYFDTADRMLKKNNIALRVRSEGENCVATLKWGGKAAVNGFFERQEINIPVSADACLLGPDKNVFSQSEDGLKLLELIGDKELENLLETRFLRKSIKLDYHGSILELAIDEGKIAAANGEAPISELEIELYSGSVQALLDITDLIARRFELQPENRSKFARGIALLEEKTTKDLSEAL